MSEDGAKPLDDELEREIQEALGEDSLLGIGSPAGKAGIAMPPDVLEGAAEPSEVPEPGHFSDAIVSGIGEEDVFIEFGPRAQGVVPRDQFASPPVLGEEVRVYVETFDRKEGIYVCALKRTLQAAAGWGSVEPGAVVMATVRAANQGGLEVQVGHLSGFLPASHLALERVEDLESVIGQVFPVEVIEADPDRRKLVVSRRAVLARERDERRAAAVRELQPGDVITGLVSRVEKFGAFVDVGGVDGLVHVSQMDWKRIEDPNDVVKPGDSVKVQVLEVSEDGSRISLGMKQLTEDPWIGFTRLHPAGSVIEGTVTRLAHYGAFIRVADAVEGLAHVSELAPNPINSPRDVVRPGDVVTVRVVNVDPERRRIGLSLLTERGDRLTDDVADDETIRDVLQSGRKDEPEPTLGDLLKKALEGGEGE
ncbi:MAG: 30S ribosomal protein S1 [Planctomycetota bacterium]|jgi:small subunit ribosomal protein S1